MTTIDIYTGSGEKEGSMELPPSIFDVTVNAGLMHQALLRTLQNRRRGVAHVKRRSEVRGSTRKLYPQKGTGRARRGSVRSPLLRGGGKAFGPRNVRQTTVRMPRAMRHRAIASCLTVKAKAGAIVALKEVPNTSKTKDAVQLFGKLPVNLHRSVLLVLPKQEALFQRSMRNIPKVKAILVSYLNPKDILSAYHILFVMEAIAKAAELFGEKEKTLPSS